MKRRGWKRVVSRAKVMHYSQVLIPVSRVDYERLERNKKDLPSFFPFYYGKTVALPEELYNEPFSHLDNGDRPDIGTRRPFFFQVREDGSTRCFVGSRTLHSPDYNVHPPSIPEKDSCNTSVVDVYHSYGLEVTYSFLRHLYYHKNYPRVNWLAAYLLGSLCVLEPDTEEDESTDVLHLSSLLMMRLVALDMEQPRALGELISAPELPDTILAKIINSERISKSLTSVVLSLRASTLPTEEELAYGSNGLDTMRVGGRYTLAYWTIDEDGECDTSLPLSEYVSATIHEWSLTSEYGVHTLVHLSGEDVKDEEVDGYTCTYSLPSYDSAFIGRNCNPRTAIPLMLEGMRDRFSIVSNQNREEVLGWIVQLSHDTRSEGGKIMHGDNELRDEVQMLIAAAIRVYRSRE